MPDERVLRDKAREAVRAGKPPARRPDGTWGGPGVGALCVVCGESVRKDQMEFEIQCQHDGALTNLDTYHLRNSAWRSCSGDAREGLRVRYE